MFLYPIDQNPLISLWVYFGKMAHLTEPPVVSCSPHIDCNPMTQTKL